METISGMNSSNPYLVVVYKRLRSLKKKLERINALDSHFALGKPLNEEQVRYFVVFNL